MTTWSVSARVLPADDGPRGLVVAAWQCRPGPLDVAGNLRRLDAACADAAAKRVDLLVTPEMFTTGYAIGAEQAARLAEPADGPTRAAVAEIAARHGLAIAYGYPERGPDGAVYNAAALVDRDGVLRGSHRKVHLFGEVDRSQFAANPTGPVAFDLAGRRAGLLICYDVEFPEAVRSLALQGAELVIVPTANMVDFEMVSRLVVPTRAYENGVFVVYANYCGSDAAFDYAGLSAVAGPDGADPHLAGTEERLLVVALSGGPLPASPYLAERRPELYGG